MFLHMKINVELDFIVTLLSTLKSSHYIGLMTGDKRSPQRDTFKNLFHMTWIHLEESQRVSQSIWLSQPWCTDAVVMSESHPLNFVQFISGAIYELNM